MNLEVTKVKKLSFVVFVLALSALIGQLFVPYDGLKAAKMKVLFPYEMIVESASGFDSVITLTDNDISDLRNKAAQGKYSHLFRNDHRDSVKTLVFDSCAFMFDITDYDAGWLGYGYSGYTVFGHDDSATTQIAVTADIGTQLGLDLPYHSFYKIRGLGLQEHGIGTDLVDTMSVAEAGANDSMVVVSLEQELPGGVSADSVMLGNRLRVMMVLKDSSQVADTLLDDGYSFFYRVWMLVKEEY